MLATAQLDDPNPSSSSSAQVLVSAGGGRWVVLDDFGVPSRSTRILLASSGSVVQTLPRALQGSPPEPLPGRGWGGGVQSFPPNLFAGTKREAPAPRSPLRTSPQFFPALRTTSRSCNQPGRGNARGGRQADLGGVDPPPLQRPLPSPSLPTGGGGGMLMSPPPARTQACDWPPRAPPRARPPAESPPPGAGTKR